MRPFGPMLRGTRDRLASQGVTVTQLAFQLVVTILGVYIAIVLQDSADQRSHARAADRTLRAIERELAADEEQLGRIMDLQTAQQEQITEMARAVRDPDAADTTILRLIDVQGPRNITYFSRSAAYETLVSTGQLEHVDDERLRLALANIYEHDYDRLRLNGEISDGIWNNVFFAAKLAYWDFAAQRPISSDERAAIGVSNAAFRVAHFGRNYVTLLGSTRDRVRETRALVDEYLEGR